MNLKLEIAGCSDRHVIRSIADAPGILIGHVSGESLGFAVNPRIEPSKANGPGTYIFGDPEEESTSLDLDDVLDAITDARLLERVVALASVLVAQTLTMALREANYPLAHAAIVFAEEAQLGLVARKRDLIARRRGA